MNDLLLAIELMISCLWGFAWGYWIIPYIQKRFKEI